MTRAPGGKPAVNAAGAAGAVDAADGGGAAGAAAAGRALRFDVITLFPEMFAPFTRAGINRRAFEGGAITLKLWNPRDFAQGNYRRVDDRPFGGGPGMVMLAEPLHRCLMAALADRAASGHADCTASGHADGGAASGAASASASMACVAGAQAAPQGGAGVSSPAAPAAAPVVLFSPIGQRLDHAGVAHWAAGTGAVLVCGRYEGIDQRFIDRHVTHQISLGDFVLSGGEIAALALLDAAARLQPGVLGDEGSHQADSFNPALDGLLDCPHYTRPEVWMGQGVPPELLGGHHANIERWRRDARLQLTARLRPDLLAQARQAQRLDARDERAIAAANTARKGRT